eukprot:323288-Rhodomonas_salina.1
MDRDRDSVAESVAMTVTVPGDCDCERDRKQQGTPLLCDVQWSDTVGYAMSASEVGWAGMPAVAPCLCYAMSGTEIGSARTLNASEVRYPPTLLAMLSAMLSAMPSAMPALLSAMLSAVLSAMLSAMLIPGQIPHLRMVQLYGANALLYEQAHMVLWKARY